jgi:hypothetical protein
MSYMLAIEPHQGQAGILREDVGSKTRTKLTVVNSVVEALSAIDDQMPELVLLSALTPPHEESQLIARLRDLPQATAPEILMIPALDGPGAAAEPRHTLFDRFSHRKQLSGCDPSAFAVQLSRYLRHQRPVGSLAGLALSADASDADRRAASRLERVDWATLMIDGSAVNLVDLSVTGAQILASMVLLPRGSVEVTLSKNRDLIRCEAGVVWGGFEIPGGAQAPWYRAGIHFKDADRDALERLVLEGNPSRRFYGRPTVDKSTALVLRGSVTDLENQKNAAATTATDSKSIIRTPATRSPRAARGVRAEKPWYSTVRFPWGLELPVLNISTTGLLLESKCRLELGHIAALTLCGPDAEVVVTASIVRSEVAHVDGLGVKYHVAATFDRPLELPTGPKARAAGVPATTLGELMTKMSADLDRGSRASRRATLERNIRRLVAAREIQIREEPIAASPGGVSMSFSAPTISGSRAIVQALFDRGSEPTPLERKLLRAAAGLAAVVLDFDEEV